jgi:hypothetical protein
MSNELAVSNYTFRTRGWVTIAAIVIFYVALYAVNYWLPLTDSDYSSRIWNWSQAALTVGACFALVLQWRHLTIRAILLGLVLAILSATSHSLHNPSLSWSLQEGIAVWICFLAGVVLFKDLQTVAVPAFQFPLSNIGRSMLIGISFAIPLSVINNLYFYFSEGAAEIQSVLYSASTALSPAIHEEIVFRFFVIALVLNALRSSTSPRRTMVIAIFLAVVPHSLNHLPDLFRQSPVMGLTLLVATSLLFGLPMAILQVRKNLEAAISFHWFIDFARFLFGF